MISLERLKNRLSRVGVTMEDDQWTLHCHAPKGYVWKAEDAPTLSIEYATNIDAWLAVKLREFTPMLRQGLIKITDKKKAKRFKMELADESSPAVIEFH